MDEQEIYQNAYNQAIKYLSIRLHTLGELQDKLLRKKFPQNAVLKVLQRLEELDFINDERYAQVFTENLKQYKDFGYYGIKAKLSRKRIPTEIIARVLEEFYTLEDEMAVAGKYAEKLKRQGRGTYEKLARSMASKGFRTEVIGTVAREEIGE